MRIDYLSPTLYLTDLIIAAIIIFRYIIFYASSGTVSLKKTVLGFKYLRIFHIRTLGQFYEKIWLKSFKNKKKYCLKFLFAGGIILNILLAYNPTVSLIKWIKIAEISILATIIFRLRISDFKQYFFRPFALSYFLITLIGIWQFILQRSVGGIFYFLGERTFSNISPGIALTQLSNREYLRIYSVFSHPNSFAAYLVVGGILMLKFREKSKTQRFNFGDKFSTVGRFAELFWLILFFGGIAICLTFSRWVLASLLISIIVYWFFNLLNSQFRRYCLFFWPYFLFFLSLIMLLLPLEVSRNILDKSVRERFLLGHRTKNQIINRPILGIGLNNSLIYFPAQNIKDNELWTKNNFLFSGRNFDNEEKYREQDLNIVLKNLPNQISGRVAEIKYLNQPVHNVYLLILAETGISGLLVFLLLLSLCFYRTAGNLLSLSLIFLTITGFADHYWFTLQQNLLLCAIVFGLTLKKNLS